MKRGCRGRENPIRRKYLFILFASDANKFVYNMWNELQVSWWTFDKIWFYTNIKGQGTCSSLQQGFRTTSQSVTEDKINNENINLIKLSSSYIKYNCAATIHMSWTFSLTQNKTVSTYILLDVLVCSIAVYFYESCSILASPKGESKYKWWVQIYSDTTH